MNMQILSKRPPKEILDILEVNTDGKTWSWISSLRKKNIFPVCAKLGKNKFILKRRKVYPSFFTALLYGDIEEEEIGCRISIKTKIGLPAKLVFVFFITILGLLILFDVPLPQYYKKSFFVYVAFIGTVIYFVGRHTVKPDERYLSRFIGELFEDGHVIFT